jgi:hypothetical protein
MKKYRSGLRAPMLHYDRVAFGQGSWEGAVLRIHTTTMYNRFNQVNRMLGQ